MEIVPELMGTGGDTRDSRVAASEHKARHTEKGERERERESCSFF